MTNHKPSTEADQTFEEWANTQEAYKGFSVYEAWEAAWHARDAEVAKLRALADLARAVALREAAKISASEPRVWESSALPPQQRIAAKILSLITQSAADALTKHDAELFRKPNGCFSDRVFTEILVPASCGVPGHFKFQENGGHCMMCQKHHAELESVYAKVRELVVDMDHIKEYWNRSENDRAMSDALYHIMDVAAASKVKLSAILPPAEERRSDG